ncbi:hypothetical protein M0R45_002144 [Rubus argutus]|uniref:Uncharacterized protein n=1 Tax=Rubus argutus TaxID=59490 RepID=A0AAW1VIV0_RUBAR
MVAGLVRGGHGIWAGRGGAAATRCCRLWASMSWALGAEIIATRAMRTEDVRLGATPEMGCDGFWKPGQIKGGPAWYGQCTVAAKAEKLRRRDRAEVAPDWASTSWDYRRWELEARLGRKLGLNRNGDEKGEQRRPGFVAELGAAEREWWLIAAATPRRNWVRRSWKHGHEEIDSIL